MKKLKQKWSDFSSNEEGVIAIEFSYVFPVLLVLFLIAVEVNHYLKFDRQLTTASNMVGDRISQIPAPSRTALSADVDIADVRDFIQIINTTFPTQMRNRLELRVKMITRDVQINATTTQTEVTEFIRWQVDVKNGVQTLAFDDGEASSGNSDKHKGTVEISNFSDSFLPDSMNTSQFLQIGVRDYILVEANLSYISPLRRLVETETDINQSYVAVPRFVDTISLCNLNIPC